MDEIKCSFEHQCNCVHHGCCIFVDGEGSDCNPSECSFYLIDRFAAGALAQKKACRKAVERKEEI